MKKTLLTIFGLVLVGIWGAILWMFKWWVIGGSVIYTAAYLILDRVRPDMSKKEKTIVSMLFVAMIILPLSWSYYVTPSILNKFHIYR